MVQLTSLSRGFNFSKRAFAKAYFLTSFTLVAGGLTGTALPALAAPPPNADPSLAPWFNSLHAPDTGVSCCSIADCRATNYRTKGDHYEVQIEDKWLVVPGDKVLQHIENPVGRAVVCWTPALGIMCFVRATETDNDPTPLRDDGLALRPIGPGVV